MMISKGINDISIDVPKDAYDTGKDAPTFNAYLTVIVRDSEGRVIKVHRQRSHSPTTNFLGILLPIIYFTNTGSSYKLTNIGGGTCSYMANPPTGTSTVNISYPSNNSTGNYPTYLVMIQVGSGSQSNPASATSLASPIANGSGSGKLVYGAISLPSNIIVSSNSAYFYVSQTYSNLSGGTIIITEVGLVIQLQLETTYNNGAAGNNINCGQLLVWYDVLSSSISVPNGGSVTIYYTFTVNP